MFTYADNGSTERHDVDCSLSAHFSHNTEQPEGKSAELNHPESWVRVGRSWKCPEVV